MKKIVAYGVSIRNTKENSVFPEQTIPMQELESIGYDKSNIKIDIVRSGDSDRPILDEIIADFTSADTIVMYSINTLFKGKANKGIDYYKRILAKGIKLLIFDFTGAVAKISKYSTVSLSGERYTFNAEELIEQLQSEISLVSSIVGKKIKGNIISDAYLDNQMAKSFIDIYFAYEAYTIDLDTTLNLLRDYCGVQTKVTFWRLSADFERTFSYVEKLKEYCEKNGRSILYYPKRCGGIPNEYYEIKKLVDANTEKLSLQQKINCAINQLRLAINKDIYCRWQKSANNEMKPRKPLPGFDMREFEKNHLIMK